MSQYTLKLVSISTFWSLQKPWAAIICVWMDGCNGEHYTGLQQAHNVWPCVQSPTYGSGPVRCTISAKTAYRKGRIRSSDIAISITGMIASLGATSQQFNSDTDIRTATARPWMHNVDTLDYLVLWASYRARFLGRIHNKTTCSCLIYAICLKCQR